MKLLMPRTVRVKNALQSFPFINSTFRKSVDNKRFVQTKTSDSADAMTLELVDSAKSFEGEQRYYTHFSDTVNCKMNLGVYLPPKAVRDKKDCPVLYFLNGLTSTHENFLQKSGVQRLAAQFGICVVSPDTSPRNVEVPAHDFLGPGASFYMDALQEPWAKHYQMCSYVTKELIELINNNLPVLRDKQSISGFSMGGYGALVCSLRNPGLYQSVSAFAPATNPMSGGAVQTPLIVYIGQDREEWKKWDPCALVESYAGKPMEIFIEQGTCDEYTEGKHLVPENFVAASAKNDRVRTIFKEREGYNHSHYYIATFLDEHIAYHSEFLNS